MVKLDAWERENMVSVLEWRTRFSYEYLKSLPDKELNELYEKRVIDWETENLTKVKK
jgi:hypothetical protein